MSSILCEDSEASSHCTNWINNAKITKSGAFEQHQMLGSCKLIVIWLRCFCLEFLGQACSQNQFCYDNYTYIKTKYQKDLVSCSDIPSQNVTSESREGNNRRLEQTNGSFMGKESLQMSVTYL